MTSQNSTNNQANIQAAENHTAKTAAKKSTAGVSFGRLLREDLRRKTGLTALSLLGSFLSGPVLFLFMLTNDYHSYLIPDMQDPEAYFQMLRTQTCISFLERSFPIFQLIVAFLGALIVGWFGMRYLFSKRMVDLYHSAPVSRGRLFLASWLSGFLIWFVPFLASSLFIAVGEMIAVNDPALLGTILGLVLRNVLLMTLSYLIVYHTCLAAVMFSGNMSNAMMNTLLCGLFFFAGFWLYYGFMQTFMKHFYLPDGALANHPVFLLAPLVTLVLMYAHLSSADPFLTWAWLPVGGTVIMLLNGFLAYFLYQRRPSELAERGVDNRIIRIVLRTAASFLSGLAFALFFRSLTSAAQTAWLLFGAFFGSALAFCVLNIVFHASIKELFSHKRQYAGVLAATALVCLAINFDVFGYDSYLPAKNSITGLSLVCDNRLYNNGYITNENGYVVRNRNYRYGEISSAPRFTDREAIYDLLSAGVSSQRGDSPSIGVFVKVSTRLGSYYRRYTLACEQLQTLAPFVESKEYLDFYYPFEQLVFGMPDSIRITGIAGQERILYHPQKIQQFMSAYHQDFEEHSSLEDLLCVSARIPAIHCAYPSSEEPGSSVNNLSGNIPEWYTHTLALLREWYPEDIWSMQEAKIVSITGHQTNIYGDVNLSLHENLCQYFGNPLAGEPLDPPFQSYPTAKQGETAVISYELEISDAKLIEKLRPYLLLGSYGNYVSRKYISLGTVLLSDGSQIPCDIEYGTLPPELIGLIEQNASQQPYLDSDATYCPDEVYLYDY